MTKGLYIGSTSAAAGKTMLTVGIGLHLQKQGINFGYMKPVGDSPELSDDTPSDRDAMFVQEVFGFNEIPDAVTPILATQDFKVDAFSNIHADYLPKIASAYTALAKDKDIMLVAGSGNFFSNKFCDLDGLRIIQELGLKAIIVERITSIGADCDLLLTIKEMLGDHMIGVVLNDVPPSFATEVENVIRPFLEKKGIPILGVIQTDPVMRSIKASELAKSLGGRLVTAQDQGSRRVERFLIGTMQVENFMMYFRRQPNSAVLVGGDRADIQLVAIEGECPCIVLTGNLFPNDIILSRAETLKVPTIMVRDDTYTVAKKMESLLLRHKMRDISKVRQAAQLVNASFDFTALNAALGI